MYKLQQQQQKNLQIFKTSYVHCEGKEILQVAMIKLQLRIWVGCSKIASQWSPPEELNKVLLSLS